MKVVEQLHEGFVHARRTRVLSEIFIPWIPSKARVLDVGCGDGLLSSHIGSARPDITLEGVDVLVRDNTFIPVKPFDGQSLPFSNKQFDVVMFVDVLHHTKDPKVLLTEAARVAAKCILIKDHFLKGFLAKPTLRFMDWIGNAHHNVALPYNYWPEKCWHEAFRETHLKVSQWNPSPPLYPFWASWLFGRSLHFAASLDI